MRKALSLLLLFPLFGCSHHGSNLAKPSTQQDFGVEMARMNLWREAQFRFRRAVDLNPGDAMAHNNLAVALEANGNFDDALKEYREALRLDRGNSYIQKNYSRFTEFMSRNKKRQGQRASGPQPRSSSATDEQPKRIATPPSMGQPPVPGPVIPGTEALPPGIVTPPSVPMPGNPPDRRPPGGVQ
jgi:tetratricopeptide (TPR) repeat protein